MKDLGIYLHIPFCIRKCHYCDFCSFPKSEDGYMEKYAAELCRRIREFTDRQSERRAVSTVYFGGGTPTLMPAVLIREIMQTVFECFALNSDAEITAECNPASIDRSGLKELREMGINRISIGLQSANDNELSSLGRAHSFDDFKKTFYEAREVGFDNISVDLMYGIPEQTVDSFEKTLESVACLSPEHISAYGLKIEEGTVFAAKRDALKLPDEEEEYAMYCACEERLAKNGYRRYEISNFAKRGYESKHNMRYWKLEDYIGFGVAAHSCVDGVRFGNSRDINAFLRGEDITEEISEITPRDALNEFVMLGLRLEDGLDLCEYERLAGRSLFCDAPRIKAFIEQGFLKLKDNRLSFTTKGFFVSNAILCEILSFG